LIAMASQAEVMLYIAVVVVFKVFFYLEMH